jgi:hypothetical protein
MVGDDQIETERSCKARRFVGADPAIDRNHEANPVRVQPIQRRRLEAVAVAQTLWYEVDDVGAQELQCAAQDDGRSHPIHVVIAMDGNAFMALDGSQDSLHRRRHVGQLERVVEIVE